MSPRGASWNHCRISCRCCFRPNTIGARHVSNTGAAVSTIDAAASFNQSSSATSAAEIPAPPSTTELQGAAVGNESLLIALHRAELDGHGIKSAKGVIGNACGHAEAEGEAEGEAAKGEAEASSAEVKAEENAEGEAGKSRVAVGLLQLAMAPSVVVADVTETSDSNEVVAPQ
ncbi:unnamed protein product [Closterium sp. Yama58-4]|nr:unnamed protein product [Closterium sp. Yama58-4]